MRLRLATLLDCEDLQELVERSVRGLCSEHYAPLQIEAALLGTFGVDTQLIRDGTYWVAESDSLLIGCGGWSRRKTLFGGDCRAGRNEDFLEPSDAAKIRAFFIDPGYARRGVASALLGRCESEARRAGFEKLELMATATGRHLYAKRGFQAEEPICYALTSDVSIEFIPMRKNLSGPAAPIGQQHLLT